MLAYVFWHAPREGVDLPRYEADLVAFHRALATSSIPGFVNSYSVCVRGLPWRGAGESLYEDWYRIADSAALDPLNDAAVSIPAKEAHDRLASDAVWGTGGLYRHRRGHTSNLPPVAWWFSKPEGMAYVEFQRLLDTSLPSDSSLWQRQLTLGPGSEFCALCTHEQTLDPGLGAVKVLRRHIGAGEIGFGWTTET